MDRASFKAHLYDYLSRNTDTIPSAQLIRQICSNSKQKEACKEGKFTRNIAAAAVDIASSLTKDHNYKNLKKAQEDTLEWFKLFQGFKKLVNGK